MDIQFLGIIMPGNSMNIQILVEIATRNSEYIQKLEIIQGPSAFVSEN